LDNFGKPKVLIVDDEEVLRNILSRFINKAGYETLEAKDGKEAIELYKISKPFIVISDIMMPKMDGLTLLNELKKIDKNAMVALMTGYGNEDILLEALRGGAQEKHKALEEGIWGKFIQHRLDINNNRSKKVLINSYLGTKYFAISIEDEGNGFDWKSLPALSPDNLLNYNGRGIFLTKIYYDEVIFNQKGNIVTLKKYTKHIKN